MERPHNARGLCDQCYQQIWSKGRNHCIDCGDEIDPRATRCRSCAIKACWERGDYDEECRRKQVKVAKERWERGDFDGVFDEEWRRKLSMAMKKRWERGDFDDMVTEEVRRKLSVAMKKRWEQGDFDGICDDGEWRRKVSEGVKAAWERGDLGTEEWCRKVSEGVAAAWVRGDFDNISEVMKNRWKRGDFGSEWHRRKSEATKAAWRRGDFDNRGTEEWCRQRAEIMKAAWERGAFDDVFQSPTGIELQIGTALDIMGIEHEPQYRPDGYSRVYDEFVPPDILIEVNGDYFHSEEHFPGITQRDAEKARWARENGFKLVVVWEHEIERYGAWALVMERVYNGK